MSTRGVICIREGRGGSFDKYYHHTDTYPTGIGIELLKWLKNSGEVEDLKKILPNMRHEGFIDHPEDAFLKGQGDLEYIYVVQLDGERSRIDVLRTSNPYFEKDFVFHIWGCYKQFMPKDVVKVMADVERSTHIALNIMQAYEGRQTLIF